MDRIVKLFYPYYVLLFYHKVYSYIFPIGLPTQYTKYNIQ